MKSFKFRLQQVLKTKGYIEDIKRNEFQKARSELDNKINALNSLVKEQDEGFDNFVYMKQRGTRAIDLVLSNNYLLSLSQSINIKKREAEIASKGLEKKRLELIEAVKEKKALDKLYVKQFERYKEEILKANQKAADDRTLVSFSFKNRERY